MAGLEGRWLAGSLPLVYSRDPPGQYGDVRLFHPRTVRHRKEQRTYLVFTRRNPGKLVLPGILVGLSVVVYALA